jgi:hypothetical protein
MPRKIKPMLGSWARQPQIVEERARKLANEAYDLALEARNAFDPHKFEYWRGVVDGIQGLLSDLTHDPLTRELNGLSMTLRDLG